MKKVEIESFIKSFLLFFLSLSAVIWMLIYQTYKRDIQDFEDTLYSQMKIASLNKGNSSFFKKEIVPVQKGIDLNTFYRDKNNFYLFFKINDLNNSIVKVSYPVKNLNHDEKIIFRENMMNFLKTLILIFFISILFSLYALNPYRKYLKLTNEFIKDILHDFNTPLSTMRLNISLLEKERNDKKLTRVETGINTILQLQSNLKEYLEDDIKESEKFYIDEVIKERVLFIKGAYPGIHFGTRVAHQVIYCYKDGFIRIIDNILSNACKYNKHNGQVYIKLENGLLYIKDSGIGIKNPKKAFDRFYKETSRGLGIGLHIVKKLSDKMNIPVTVQSKKEKGTTFILNLNKVTDLTHYKHP